MTCPLVTIVLVRRDLHLAWRQKCQPKQNAPNCYDYWFNWPTSTSQFVISDADSFRGGQTSFPRNQCRARIGEETKKALRRRLFSGRVRTSSLCPECHPAIRCSPAPSKVRRTPCRNGASSRWIARLGPLILEDWLVEKSTRQERARWK